MSDSLPSRGVPNAPPLAKRVWRRAWPDPWVVAFTAPPHGCDFAFWLACAVLEIYRRHSIRQTDLGRRYPGARPKCQESLLWRPLAKYGMVSAKLQMAISLLDCTMGRRDLQFWKLHFSARLFGPGSPRAGAAWRGAPLAMTLRGLSKGQPLSEVVQRHHTPPSGNHLHPCPCRDGGSAQIACHTR